MAVLVFFALLGWDVSRAPEQQWSARGLVAAIRAYQTVGSPVVRRIGARCRFQPTCSHYAVASLEEYGTLLGTWKTAGRILRCGPWTPKGTHDPP
jgi:putative membrane protein insertion efficiency factor